MKRILAIVVVILLFNNVKAQTNPYEVNENTFFVNGKAKFKCAYLDDYRWGVGAQYVLPVSALSVKYAITNHSVVQALIFPGTVNNGFINYSFYGGRYEYRFGFNYISHSEPFSLTYGYAWGCAGLLNNNRNYKDNAGNSHGDASIFAYSAGVGYEIIYNSHFGISVECGYGQFSMQNNQAQKDFTGGLGLHYYFGDNGKEDKEEETTETDEKVDVEDKDGNIIENDAPQKKSNSKNNKKSGKSKKSKDDDDDEN